MRRSNYHSLVIESNLFPSQESIRDELDRRDLILSATPNSLSPVLINTVEDLPKCTYCDHGRLAMTYVADEGLCAPHHYQLNMCSLCACSLPLLRPLLQPCRLLCGGSVDDCGGATTQCRRCSRKKFCKCGKESVTVSGTHLAICLQCLARRSCSVQGCNKNCYAVASNILHHCEQHRHEHHAQLAAKQTKKRRSELKSAGVAYTTKSGKMQKKRSETSAQEVQAIKRKCLEQWKLYEGGRYFPPSRYNWDPVQTDPAVDSNRTKNTLRLKLAESLKQDKIDPKKGVLKMDFQEYLKKVGRSSNVVPSGAGSNTVSGIPEDVIEESKRMAAAEQQKRAEVDDVPEDVIEESKRMAAAMVQPAPLGTVTIQHAPSGAMVAMPPLPAAAEQRAGDEATWCDDDVVYTVDV